MNDRPRIKIPFQSIDIVIELLSITILLTMIGYTIVEYNALPDTIPTHFNAQGVADGHSDKTSLWFIPVLSIVLYIGIFIIGKYPHLHNYMVNITEENALKNYTFSVRVTRIVNLFTVITFALVTYHIIQSSKENGSAFTSWIVPLIISISIILPIIVFVYYKKMNSKS